MLKKSIFIVMCFAIALLFTMRFENEIEAQATKKALIFLKGTWISCGHSQDTKAIFTKKYMKFYSLSYYKHGEYRVKSPKKKGKYFGKSRIISTKKKGKTWIIKVGKKGDITYYKSKGKKILLCTWKKNGEWMFSGSSSYERYSKKVYR